MGKKTELLQINNLLSKQIFEQYKLRILIAYIFTIIENSLGLLFPYTTGLAINSILHQSYSGVLYLGVVLIANGIMHVLRQRYNIRLYTTIYRDLACDVVSQHTELGIDNSKIIARSSLSREFVDFFERNIPSVLSALFRSVGALTMLFFYDARIVLYCITLAIPLYFINKKYALHSLLINSKLNDQYEKEVDILTSGEADAVYNHYNNLANIKIKLNDIQVVNWSIMEIFVVFLLITVILRAGSLTGVQAGTLYSIVSYTWNFIYSLDLVPSLVQQISRLKDIKSRIGIS